MSLLRRLAPAIVLFACPVAQAQVQAGSDYVDPRIQQVPYDANRVYPLAVAGGFAAVVEFGTGESVVSVIVGNSGSWSVSQTEAGNRLVIKPIHGAAPTNMIVVTNQHRYVFYLEAKDTALDAFVLRFVYDAPANPVPQARPGHYQLTGSKRLRPRSISDDGHDTLVVWDNASSIPAVFAYDDGGQEMIVNARMTPQGYQIEGVHPRLVFRLGKDRLVIDRLSEDKP